MPQGCVESWTAARIRHGFVALWIVQPQGFGSSGVSPVLPQGIGTGCSVVPQGEVQSGSGSPQGSEWMGIGLVSTVLPQGAVWSGIVLPQGGEWSGYELPPGLVWIGKVGLSYAAGCRIV
jgi:hypothetical protein